VVRSAPDRTLAGFAARVEAAAPDASSAGRVRLPVAEAPLEPTGPGAGKDYPELREPLALVDLVRGALEVVSGQATPESRRAAVRSFADRLGAPAFYADVWVDGQGRLRRVQVPVEKTVQRPGTRDRTLPRLVTVDLFDFEPR